MDAYSHIHILIFYLPSVPSLNSALYDGSMALPRYPSQASHQQNNIHALMYNVQKFLLNIAMYHMRQTCKESAQGCTNFHDKSTETLFPLALAYDKVPPGARLSTYIAIYHQVSLVV